MSSTGSSKDGAGPPEGRYPGPMAYASLGMLNAICLIGGCALGWLADKALGTLPLFLFVGLVAGIALGILGTRAELRRYNR
jgi:uncharacterized membrane protein